MPKILNSIWEVHYFDEVSKKNTVIHRIHPLIKLIVTFIFIITVVSYKKYELTGLMTFIFYPVIICALGEIPFFRLFKRILIVVPFILSIGIFNIFLDRSIVVVFLGLNISGGIISTITLILKTILTVMASFLLISTTGIEKIALALRLLYIPKIFVTQILLLYRYLSLLFEEASRIWKAHSLRSNNKNGVDYKTIGSLIGNMFLRSFDKAQTVYNAMLLRGFNGEYLVTGLRKVRLVDFIYFIFWSAFLLGAKFFNFSEIIGKIMIGAF